MDDKYGIFDIMLWSGAGFFAGDVAAQIVLGIMNGNRGPPDRITKIALGYGFIGLLAGSIRGYTGKSIIELIIKP
jgi:hypothetical protein